MAMSTRSLFVIALDGVPQEFVHGDRGRTTPSVASLLGCDADILQLDVEELLMGTTKGTKSE